MKVYLCEKPSQAKDLAKVIGANSRKNGFFSGTAIVTWCFGHLLELAGPDYYDEKWKVWDIDTLPIIPDHWHFQVKPDAKKQFRIVKDLILKSSDVVIATDGDREGETIARSLLSLVGYKGNLSRLWLTALDPTSIKKALNNILPGHKTIPLYHAGLARQRADWLIGMNLTRAFTALGKRQGYQNVLSVGRVQSPTLSLIVQRDLQIALFEPKDFFELHANLQVNDGEFKATWKPESDLLDPDGHITNIQTVRAIQVEGHTGKINHVETERKKQPAPLLFNLSTLTALASKKYGFTAAKTAKIAQALYETHKVTTYAGTDCEYLPKSQHQDAPAILDALFNIDEKLKPFVDKADPNIHSRAFNDEKQTAHHAIIPTRHVIELQQLSQDEFKVYDLVRRQYLAQFFPFYEYDVTIIEVTISGETFEAKGTTVINRGWKEVIQNNEKAANSNTLPYIQINEPAVCTKSEILEKQTQPPKHFTDATLISAMENIGRNVDDPSLKRMLNETAGLGTVRTRDRIIETLVSRKYIKRQKKYLISTELGRSLEAVLFDQIKDPVITAQWEQALDQIAQGNGSETDFTAQQKRFLEQLVQYMQNNIDKLPKLAFKALKTETVTYACPKCGKKLERKFSPQNKQHFWGCHGYPECKYTAPDNNGKPKKKSEQESSNIKCPKCDGQLLERGGKNGKFLGCSNFPECKHTENISTN